MPYAVVETPFPGCISHAWSSYCLCLVQRFQSVEMIADTLCNYSYSLVSQNPIRTVVLEALSYVCSLSLDHASLSQTIDIIT